MTNNNDRNIDYINETASLLDSLKATSEVNIPKVKSEFVSEAMLWNNIVIKLMQIYYNLYNAIEVIAPGAREELTINISNTLTELSKTPEYKYFEAATLNIFKDIKDDIVKAQGFGIISEEEAKELTDWTNSEIKEISCVKDNVLENFRFVNPEFSYHNHYMRLDGVHYNGLTNDTFINKILDKLYENDTSCAQIIKALLEERGFYSRRVANIMSDGTMIELYLEFANEDGCGKVRFIRSGGESEATTIFNKQEGFDVSNESEEKDPVVDRCMNELFNIIKIVEAL